MLCFFPRNFEQVPHFQAEHFDFSFTNCFNLIKVFPAQYSSNNVIFTFSSNKESGSLANVGRFSSERTSLFSRIFFANSLSVIHVKILRHCSRCCNSLNAVISEIKNSLYIWNTDQSIVNKKVLDLWTKLFAIKIFSISSLKVSG